MESSTLASFRESLLRACEGIFEPNAEQADAMTAYYALLVEWNERMNLTAVTAPEEAAQKHFADSLLAAKRLPHGAACIDVGTGAGFPGLPLLIVRPDLSMSLLDSLAKRLTFLQAVAKELGLSPKFLHERAEDAGRKAGERAAFDIVLSRAVAPMNVLCELTLPLLKIGGEALCFKGPAVREELLNAKRALKLLGGTVKEVEERPPALGHAHHCRSAKDRCHTGHVPPQGRHSRQDPPLTETLVVLAQVWPPRCKPRGPVCIGQ